MSRSEEKFRRLTEDSTAQSESSQRMRCPGPAYLAATRASLLTRLKNPDDAGGWQRFFDTYAALIHNLAIRAGCSTTEADDVLQETLLSVAKEIPDFRYEPSKGSFKSWLFRIVRRRVVDLYRKRRVGDARRLDSAVLGEESDTGNPQLETDWDDEWRAHLLAQACDRVKQRVSARQWQMFEAVSIQEWPMERITAFLGVNRAQVYMAKLRVSRLLKQALAENAET